MSVPLHFLSHATFSQNEPKGAEHERKKEANIFVALVLTFTDVDELRLELST